jgi:hypothetical protein
MTTFGKFSLSRFFIRTISVEQLRKDTECNR